MIHDYLEFFFQHLSAESAALILTIFIPTSVLAMFLVQSHTMKLFNALKKLEDELAASKQSASVMQDEISEHRAQTKYILDAQHLLKLKNDEISTLKKKISYLEQSSISIQNRNIEIERSRERMKYVIARLKSKIGNC